jgi:uncharacterized protein YndB with AHSA1/START domain
MNAQKEKVEYSITIQASRALVWEKMLDENCYRKWAEVFMKGSHYVGDWTKGSKILFLAPDKNGHNLGMVSRIKENRTHELISIEHLGFVSEDKEDKESMEAKKWAGAMENYHFLEGGGHTVLKVELETTEEYKGMFEDTWPEALKTIKKLCENP